MFDDFNVQRTLILVLVFIAAYILVHYIFRFSQHESSTLLAKRFEYFEEQIQLLFITAFTPSQFLKLHLFVIALSAAFVYWVSGSGFLGLLVVVLVWFLPVPIFDILRQKRLELFEENFPATLDKMVSSSKAGLSLIQIFEVIATHDKPPASQEFGRGVQDYKLGKDLVQVVEEMKQRIGGTLFGLFATAILINRDKGGNLPEALQTMSKSFKEIMRLNEKVTTASAEGRKGARVISLMPIFIFVFVSMMQPSLIDSLTDNFIGWVIITVAAAFYLTGVFWMRKVLAIEV